MEKDLVCMFTDIVNKYDLEHEGMINNISMYEADIITKLAFAFLTNDADSNSCSSSIKCADCPFLDVTYTTCSDPRVESTKEDPNKYLTFLNVAIKYCIEQLKKGEPQWIKN